MKQTQLLSLIASSVLLFTACRKDEIHGSGHITTEYRTVQAFTNVRVEGPIQADIRYGPHQQVAVRTDANVLPWVRTQVVDQTLVLSLAQANYGDGLRFAVTVDMPTIGRLTQNGVSDARLTGFFGLSTLEVINNGVGHITLHGSTDHLRVTQHGVGRVHAQGMPADTCQVGLSGVGNVEVRVNDLLHGYLSGVGNIYYHGTPVVDVDDTGVGNVIQVD